MNRRKPIADTEEPLRAAAFCAALRCGNHAFDAVHSALKMVVAGEPVGERLVHARTFLRHMGEHLMAATGMLPAEKVADRHREARKRAKPPAVAVAATVVARRPIQPIAKPLRARTVPRQADAAPAQSVGPCVEQETLALQF